MKIETIGDELNFKYHRTGDDIHYECKNCGHEYHPIYRKGIPIKMQNGKLDEIWLALGNHFKGGK